MGIDGVAAERTSGAEADTTGGSKRRWGRWVRVVLGVGLLAILLTQVDLAGAIRVVAGARLELLLLALLILLASRIIAALRWYLLVRGRHSAATPGAVVRIMFVSSFAGYFLPGSVGVEVLRIYGLGRRMRDPALSATSVLVERLVATAVLVLLVLVGAAARPPGLPERIDLLAWLCLGVLVLGVLALMAPPARRLALRLLPGRRLARIREAFGKVFVALDSYRSRPALIGGSFLLAFVFQLMRCASVTVNAAALGHPLPFTFIMIVYPAMLLVSLLPISIAGLGVREVSFVYFLGLGGMPAEVALPLALIQRFFAILATLPGAWWYMKGGLNG